MRAIVLAFACTVLSTTGYAYDPIVHTPIVAATATTMKIKGESPSGTADTTTAMDGAPHAYRAVQGAEAPSSRAAHPSPYLRPSDVRTPSLSGLPSIPSNFDRVPLLKPHPIAKSASPDVLGAFRFICRSGQILYDDPIVYPGQPGRSHLHQFFGNTAANAHSTYTSLRTTGESGCNNKLNRSAYWMPAMMDDKAVYKPDHVQIYYKRRPKSDPKCQGLARGGEGTCIPLPNGLRYIFGYDMVTGKPPTGSPAWYCSTMRGSVIAGPDRVSKRASFQSVMQYCQVGQRLLVQNGAPNCWDGKRLDSTNHRDHMAYAKRNRMTGAVACPASHRYVVAAFTLTAVWHIDQALKDAATTNRLHLSSDPHVLGAAPGSTFHADWWGAWDDPTKFAWEEDPQGCINGLRNCSSGNLGNGTRIIDSAASAFSTKLMQVPIPTPEPR